MLGKLLCSIVSMADDRTEFAEIERQFVEEEAAERRPEKLFY